MGIVTLIIAISAIIFDIALTIVLVKAWLQIKKMRCLIDKLLTQLKDKTEKQQDRKDGGIFGLLDDIMSNIAETFTDLFGGAMK